VIHYFDFDSVKKTGKYELPDVIANPDVLQIGDWIKGIGDIDSHCRLETVRKICRLVAADNKQDTIPNGVECSKCLQPAPSEPVCMYCHGCYSKLLREVERLQVELNATREVKKAKQDDQADDKLVSDLRELGTIDRRVHDD